MFLQKLNKIIMNLFLILFSLLTFGGKALSLTDYQIKRFCEKEKRELICKKNLQEKRSNLQRGNPIEIPVVPYKR